MVTKKNFSEQELNLISDVTHIALGNAGSAMAKMVRDEFLIKGVEIKAENPENHFKLLDQNEKYHMLFTEVVGDLSAATYLLISPEVENILCDVLLPGSMLGRAEMREATMLEIDNIVIAAMVTKFSEILGQNIHGDVPAYQQKARTEVESEISHKLAEMDACVSFRGRITTFYKGISIEFICFFDDSIVNAIKNFDFDKRRQLNVAPKSNSNSAKEEKGVSSFFKKIFS